MILPWSFPVFCWHLEEQISLKHGKSRQFRKKRNPFQICQPHPHRFFLVKLSILQKLSCQRNCKHAYIKKWMECDFIIIRRPQKSQNDAPCDLFFVGRAHGWCLKVHCCTPDNYSTATVPLKCLSSHRFGVEWLHKPVKILPPFTDLSCSRTALESVALMWQTTSYTRRHTPTQRALSLISWIKATNTWTESSLYSLLQSQPAKRRSADQRAKSLLCTQGGAPHQSNWAVDGSLAWLAPAHHFWETSPSSVLRRKDVNKSHGAQVPFDVALVWIRQGEPAR